MRARAPRRWLRVAPFVLALAAAGALAAPAAELPVHVHTAQAGDTLIGLGQRLLVDPARWPELQRLNQVRNPRRIPVGTPLRIPLHLMRTEAVDAHVLAVVGGARSGGAALSAGQPLPEGSELVTDAGGHVTVRLVDGTLLRLRPGSRASLSESRRVPGTDATQAAARLEQGRIEVQARKAPAGRPGFRIGTPQGVLGVRGTEFRVSVDADVTRGEVLEGLVAVSGAARGAPAVEQRVAAGFGTAVDAAGRLATPQALLPPPDLSGLPAVQERPLVRLPMPAQAGAQAWRVQVARDAAFDQVLADVRSTTPELRVAGLDDGRYPMRLRAVGADGLEGLDAVGTLVLKARPEPPLPRAPASKAVVMGERADFAWAAASDARRYRLQLARADAGAALFTAPLNDRKDIDAVSLSIDGLAPGPYLWRVASVRADGDQGPFGDALAFEVRALPPRPAPPQPPQVGDQGVSFFWQGQPGQRFDFEVARDDAFARIVERRQLDVTQITLPLPGNGRFHVRLRVRDADGFVGPWSASQHFDVIPCMRDTSDRCVRVDSGPLQLQQ